MFCIAKADAVSVSRIRVLVTELDTSVIHICTGDCGSLVECHISWDSFEQLPVDHSEKLRGWKIKPLSIFPEKSCCVVKHWC